MEIGGKNAIRYAQINSIAFLKALAKGILDVKQVDDAEELTVLVNDQYELDEADGMTRM